MNWEQGKQAWRRLPHPLRWLGVALVGGSLLIAGGIMLITPGPGIPVIVLGLVVLATEFAWAERTLHRVRHEGGRAWQATRSRLRRR